MIDYIYLEPWKAIELFCRLVAKFEPDTHLDDFRSNKFLLDKLDLYNSKKAKKDKNGKNVMPPSFRLAEAIFKTKFNDRGVEVYVLQTEVYELTKDIKHALPIYRQRDTLSKYLNYIEGAKHSDYWYENVLNPKAVFSDKFREFEDTYWWFIYSDRKVYSDGTERIGVTKALLILKSFGHAEIYRQSGSKDIQESYTGRFSLLGDENMLLLEMKRRNKAKRFTQILLDIGTGNVEFAIGGAINHDRDIYITTALIIPIKNFDETMRLETKFYSFETDEKDIPAIARSYFEDRNESYINIPGSIYSTTSYWKWKSDHERERAKSATGNGH